MMLPVAFSLLACAIVASAQSEASAATASIFTAERVYQEIVSESPFIVQRTEQVVWTQTTTIIEVDTVTATTVPTGNPA
ncbi:hypothetical protein ONZ45_g11453 [Pleurotus djamor]|nr:hypothetical protein ONZ45_g11453 [Pleurotus djamor]